MLIRKMQNKIDHHGIFMFHGLEMDSIKNIITTNFLIDSLPHQAEETEGQRWKKVMVFERGIYFSEIPAVSLMYGIGLLL